MLTEIHTPKVTESVTLTSGFSILRKVEDLNAFLLRSGPDSRDRRTRRVEAGPRFERISRSRRLRLLSGPLAGVRCDLEARHGHSYSALIFLRMFPS
jgi:hypothetical protein